MSRLRYRLARWLVGPFVNVPEHDGVWLVSRMGGATITTEVAEFSMTMSRDLSLRRFGDPDQFADWSPRSGSLGTFTGTIKQ